MPKYRLPHITINATEYNRAILILLKMINPCFNLTVKGRRKSRTSSRRRLVITEVTVTAPSGIVTVN